MGTRSTTKFFEVYSFNGKTKKEFLGGIYRQYDGYISGHGAEIKGLLAKKKLTNGFGLGMTPDEYFNGIGCLGAWIISQLKKEIGNIYLATKDDVQEYNYEIYNHGNDIHVIIKTAMGKILYNGHIDNMPDDDL